MVNLMSDCETHINWEYLFKNCVEYTVYDGCVEFDMPGYRNRFYSVPREEYDKYMENNRDNVFYKGFWGNCK